MKTILAPTDFSNSSLNAVNYAADMALAVNAKLVLFHAIPFPIAVSEVSLPGDFIDDMMDAGQREMDELCEKIKLRTKDKIVVESDVKIGSVELEIENISLKERPLATIIAIRSGKSLERAFMGSSVFHILNHTDFPTIVVPENRQFEQIRNIGMACDFKRVDEDLPFEKITEWLHLFNANLEIINITPRDMDFKADQVVESISLQNRLVNFKPRFHFLTGNNIPEELDQFVNNYPLDLLMVFPRKHGIFKLFYKKKSKLIVNHTHIPILVIRDK
jgi:nucleotide-binding universal stress UspA family protein